MRIHVHAMYNVDPNLVPDKPVIQIANNTCYELLYDGVKNRVCLTIKGFWKNQQSVPNFLDDIRQALTLVKRGFTVLTDLRTMITHPQELNAIHQQAHTMVMEAGVLQVAHVVPEDRIAKLQTSSIQDFTGLPVHNFTSLEEAEEWLNQTGPLPGRSQHKG